MNKRILIVDEDPSLLRLAETVLKKAYDVVATQRPEDALDPGVEFDLLITAMQIRGTSGIELVQKVRARFPRLPCLVLAGGFEPGEQRWLAQNRVGYLSRPHAMDGLKVSVAHMLAP